LGSSSTINNWVMPLLRVRELSIPARALGITAMSTWVWQSSK
jgi:hypothetical protein